MRNFNFFEPFVAEKNTRPKTDYLRLLAIVASFLVIGGIILTTGYQMMAIRNNEKEIASLNQSLEDPAFQQNYQKALEKEKELATIKVEQTFLESIGDSMNRIDRVNETIMHSIANEVVDNLYLTRFSIEGNQMEIQGKSLTKLGIAQFEYDLRKSSDFEKIHVNSIKKLDNVEGYEFLMTVNMGEVKLSENQ